MAYYGRSWKMGKGGRFWRAVAVFAVALLTLPVAPASAVDIIEDKPETVEAGWQAGTCTSDLPHCSVETPDQFFTQAAGHPPVGFTQIIVKHSQDAAQNPVGHIKTVLVDLPKGLSVNPEATPKCELVEGKFPISGCPANTKVGYSEVTPWLVLPLPVVKVDVYN